MKILSIPFLRDYNILVFKNITLSNTMSEGMVAVGGDTTFKNYEIGSKSSSTSFYKPIDSLIIGGNVDINGGTNYLGNTVIDYFSNIIENSMTCKNGILKRYSPLNFDTQRQQALRASNSYGSLSMKGTASVNHGQLTLKDTDNDLCVFNVDSTNVAWSKLGLAQLEGINLITKKNATILINIFGTNIMFGNYQMFIGGEIPTEADATRIMWNFPEATSWTNYVTNIYGSVLAASANANTAHNKIYGNIIFDSLVGNVECHNALFNKDLPMPNKFGNAGQNCCCPTCSHSTSSTCSCSTSTTTCSHSTSSTCSCSTSTTTCSTSTTCSCSTSTTTCLTSTTTCLTSTTCSCSTSTTSSMSTTTCSTSTTTCSTSTTTCSTSTTTCSTSTTTCSTSTTTCSTSTTTCSTSTTTCSTSTTCSCSTSTTTCSTSTTTCSTSTTCSCSTSTTTCSTSTTTCSTSTTTCSTSTTTCSSSTTTCSTSSTTCSTSTTTCSTSTTTCSPLACCMREIVSSISAEENAIAKNLIAEAAKIKKAVEISTTVDELVLINSSLQRTINAIIDLELVLLKKLEKVASTKNN